MSGVGETLSGRRDHDPETSTYVTAHCLCVLFVPVVAGAAVLRRIHADEGELDLAAGLLEPYVDAELVRAPSVAPVLGDRVDPDEFVTLAGEAHAAPSAGTGAALRSALTFRAHTRLADGDPGYGRLARVGPHPWGEPARLRTP